MGHWSFFIFIHSFPINRKKKKAQKYGRNSGSVYWAQVWLLKSFSLTFPSGSTDRRVTIIIKTRPYVSLFSLNLCQRPKYAPIKSSIHPSIQQIFAQWLPIYRVSSSDNVMLTLRNLWFSGESLVWEIGLMTILKIWYHTKTFILQLLVKQTIIFCSLLLFIYILVWKDCQHHLYEMSLAPSGCASHPPLLFPSQNIGFCL